MANLTQAEKTLFSMFWGKENLIDDDHFWRMAGALLSSEDGELVLPLSFNPLTVRRVLGMLQCSPGKCGACCRYKRITLTDLDVERIVSNTDFKDISGLVNEDESGKFLSGEGEGCPFLKDNVCQIYGYRPDVCYLFPIQGGKKAFVNGKEPFEAMRLRLKCQPAMEVARAILRESMALNEGKTRLLPDLSIVPILEEQVIQEE